MRRKTPREKKDLEYIKDHVTFAESVHGARKTWPRKEARVTRAYRRLVRQRIGSFQARHEDDFPDEENPMSVRRQRVRKLGVLPFGEVLRRRKEKRLEGTMHNFLSGSYYPIYGREHFAAFLSSQVGGRTEKSRMLAQYLQELMDIPQKYVRTVEQYWWWEKKREWLLAFFRDEPEWEERVRAWIASFAEQ